MKRGVDESRYQKLSIVRWIRLIFIFAIPILGYIYRPFEKLPDYAPATRFVFLPVMVVSGLWMGKGHLLRRLYFEEIGNIKIMSNVALPKKQREEIIKTLKARFEKNINRHKDLRWAEVQRMLEANAEKLSSLHEMERTGGEPDVVGHDKKTGEYIFYDCSEQSPKGRRSLCYDREALESRKADKPKDNATDMAAAMGIALLTEQQYRELQKLGNFDTKTSSWVKTPADIRKLGGALFCDRRFHTVFVYHNGAESYYAARGFRGSLRV